jgi:hypothetical protein
MENIEEEVTAAQPTLVVSEEIRSYLYDMAKWANFLAIVGFVFTALVALSALTIGSAMATNPEVAAMIGKMGNAGGVVFTVFCLAYAFAIFYPSLLLFKYSAKAKLGVLYGEQDSLNDAMGKLKSLFKYWGIITIIFISLYALLILSSVLAQVKG